MMLLIVPYGIETVSCILFLLFRNYLLIVPYGIETLLLGGLNSILYCLLIAKNGADCYSKNGDAVTVLTWQS